MPISVWVSHSSGLSQEWRQMKEAMFTTYSSIDIDSDGPIFYSDESILSVSLGEKWHEMLLPLG